MALLSRKTDFFVEPIVAESPDSNRAVEELTRLQRMSAALVGCLDLESILQRIVEGSAEGLEADRAVVFMLDEEGSVLSAAACGPEKDHSADTILNLTVPVATTDPVSAAVLARGPYLGTDTGASGPASNGMGRWLGATLGTHHVNVAPLMVGERVLGVLTVDNHIKDKPVGCRPSLLMAYAAVAALAIERATRDRTDHKREEDRHLLLSSITEQSFDAILSTDREGKITSWNNGAERIFGYRSPEIVGRHWLDLAPADREEEFRATMRPFPATDTKGLRLRTLDSVARGADGRLVPVKISVSVLHDGNSGGEAGWSVIFRDLTEQKTLAEISERLQDELHCRNRLEGIIGNSAVIEDVRDRIRRVARFNSSVLVVGQSGTGKELVANAIHYNSPRAKNPFVKVNCAAIPEDLLESELFGIERNVATGVDGRIGRFEMAAGGTLFLDEIGDMSLSTQAKILRVLQEREFERVGGKRTIKIDVRIIAATNKNLESEIKARRFRVDLFYRLNVIVIALPALAERREDIEPLIDHFLDRFAKANDLPRKEMSLQSRLLLNRYGWPGNVRELEHCIERAVVMCEGEEIAENDLPPSILIWRDLGGTRPHTEPGTLQDILYQVERSTVKKALERSDWIQARAARTLGISERSMWYRVKKLDLKPPTH